MAREIPGFFYDEEKGKYFRIQANHRVVAGIGYTKQSVKAIKQAKEDEQRMQKQTKRRQDGTIIRSKILLNTTSPLSARLGRSVSRNRMDFTEQYARNLSSLPLIAQSVPGVEQNLVFDGFTVDIARSGVLRACQNGPNFGQRCINSYYSTYNTNLSLFVDHAYSRLQSSMPLNGPQNQTLNSIFDSGRETALICTDTQCGINFIPIDTYGRPEDLTIYFSLQYATRGEVDTIWDLAVSPDKPYIALAMHTGLKILEYRATRDIKQTTIFNKKEQMTVSFKDSHTVMSGERSGQIILTDTRSNSSVVRLLHSSAVLATVALRDGNQIIAHGFSTTSSYDLRWTQEPVSNRARSTDKKKHSRPYLEFAVPRERRTNVYSAGRKLAYSSDLEMIAAVSTNASAGLNFVTLYSARTGRVLDSPLTRRSYDRSVNSVEVRRVRDGMESIVCFSDRTVEEWSCGRSETHDDDGDRVNSRNTEISIHSSAEERRELGIEEEWERTALRHPT